MDQAKKETKAPSARVEARKVFPGRRGVYENRELSWLSFDERVLDLSGLARVPYGERLSFLSIYNSNLDEFYRVRVGTLMTQSLSPKAAKDSKTGLTSSEQVALILKETKKLEKKAGSFYSALRKEGKSLGLRLHNFSQQKKKNPEAEKLFRNQIAPFLSPMIISRAQPFPFLENQQIYALVVLKKNGKNKLGIILCANDVFPRLLPVPGKDGAYALSEDLILHYAGILFPKYEIVEKSLLRVTRNADISFDEVEEDDQGYLDGMEKLIRQRKRLSPVRVEYSRKLSKGTLAALSKYLELPEDHFLRLSRPLDLSFLSLFRAKLSNPSLFYPPFSPQYPSYFSRKENAIDQVERKDVLLSYPYQSMKPFLSLLQDAARDPRVVSISMTLYRVADHSEVVQALSEAATNGKEVIVLVELRARFDEENNIEASRLLENSGCHVIYGLERYKVHSKLCLITLKEKGLVRYITQVGTGNYNEKTAKHYTDFCLMTADSVIGQDAHQLFNGLLQGDTISSSRKLLVAPEILRDRILSYCDEQIALARAGKDAYLGFKVNALTDKGIIDKLVEASNAGVKVELLIRGICFLIPGIVGSTQNIRVVSVVGRYLEHGRIYRFGKGKEERIYLSSADLMTRNTQRRVEVAVPVEDPSYKAFLDHYFDTLFHDTTNGRELLEDGYYHWRPGPALNAQETFEKEALQDADEGRKEEKR